MSILKTRTQIPLPYEGEEVIFRTKGQQVWAGKYFGGKFRSIVCPFNEIDCLPVEDIEAWIGAAAAFTFCELNNA